MSVITYHKLSKCLYHSVFTCLALFLSNTLTATPLTANIASQLPYQSILKIKGKYLHTEVVSNDKSRAQGLMYRQSMPYDAGMLFVFQDQRHRCFWMKNTFLPLSIAYIDNTGTILEIYDMEPLSEKSVCSEYPVSFALEVNQGWYQFHDVQVGDTLKVISPLQTK